jgi:hypothetical protein
MGTLLLVTDKVANLTGRCRIYETLYLPTNRNDSDDGSSSSSRSLGRGAKGLDPAGKELATGLLLLYTAVLRLLAAALHLYNKNTASRALRALLDLAKVTDLLGDCQTLEARVDIEASNCERASSATRHEQLHASLQALLQALQAPVLRTDTHVAAVWERSGAAQHAAIMRWTLHVTHEDMHGAARHGRTPGTTEWLLAHERFVKWRNCSASTILWLHGIRKFRFVPWVSAPSAPYAIMWSRLLIVQGLGAMGHSGRRQDEAGIKSRRLAYR